jgi:hypothetical protein
MNFLEEIKNAYKILVTKPHGRYTGIWKDNVILNLKETGPEYMDWIKLAQNSQQVGSCGHGYP